MTRKTILYRIVPVCAVVVVLIFDVLLIPLLSLYDADQVIAHDASTYVRIGEIYRNPDNVQLLYNLLLGKSAVNLDQIYQQAAIKRTASYFRKQTYQKESGQNLQVTFGGLAWQVCYLSLTGQEGDADRIPILTLLLADTDQLSMFQTWRTYDDFAATYPSNLYGTSYLRAVTMNNGGQYATGRDTLTTATPNKNHPWAIFTMEGIAGSVTDAIIKPSQVAWQENQSAIDAGTNTDNFFNEAWGVPSNDAVRESLRADYRQKVGYDCWQDDYLWLPSYTEIGGYVDEQYHGIWHLAGNQRRCGKQYWLRSVYQNDTEGVAQLTAKAEFDYMIVNNGGYYVLPALHLNLGAESLRAA
ncbi:MAG: hypothetical protein NC133_00985 [Prevotella sp.]|nr:hypothetical protein [Prevotella sp.]